MDIEVKKKWNAKIYDTSASEKPESNWEWDNELDSMEANESVGKEKMKMIIRIILHQQEKNILQRM